ncbi:MAG: carbohydrate ABC transporter permease [Alphaproteobacteria bacterium]
MPSRLVERSLTLFAALAVMLFAIGPILLAILGSVIPDRALFGGGGLFDYGLVFDNYRYIFTGQLPDAYMAEGANRAMISDAARQVPMSLLNSAIISLSTMALNILLGAPAAFAFAQFSFRGKKASFMFLILSPLVPTVALVVPFYMIVEAAGLLGTRLAVILVHTGRALPFTVLILSVFYRRIPVEIFEAAIIDGADRWTRMTRIALPLALPSIGATGLFAFMLSYAEFLFAMVLSGEAGGRPLSVVMAALARNTDVSWSLLNTAIVIAVLPTLALVVLVWRYVVEGLLAGASKG